MCVYRMMMNYIYNTYIYIYMENTIYIYNTYLYIYIYVYTLFFEEMAMLHQDPMLGPWQISN